MSLTPSPADVAHMVNEYLSIELSDVEKYDNRELLDESGRYSLHRLAAEIYARGFDDGYRVSTAERRKLS
jgi:hypothetical protein